MKKLLIVTSVIILVLAAGAAIFFIANSKNKEAARLEQIPFLREAESALAKGDLRGAKKEYQKVLENTIDAEKLKDTRKAIEDISLKLLFSSALDEGSTQYTVKPGDVLIKIANKFNTTVDLIKRANNLKSDILNVGQTLKINTSPFSILVYKSQNLLFLKRGDEILKTYVVSTGKNNCTPVGTFKIVNKLPNPTWFKAGAVLPSDSPENILGSRWLGLDKKGYGIHGTTMPQDLGKQVTAGCVRMKNEEVEELYDIVGTGTEVTVVN
jgi:lipoprotein-anchoring transpeptidase ErfK/SrfK